MNQTASRQNETDTFRISLLIWSCFALLIIKFISALHYSPESWWMFAASYIQDIFIMMLLVQIFAKWKVQRIKCQRRVNIMYAIVQIFFLISCRIYSRHAPDLLDFPVNLFGVHTDTASFFIAYFLDSQFILEILLTSVALAALSIFLPFNIPQKSITAGFLLISLIFPFSLIGQIANPIIYSIIDEAKGRLSKNYHLKRLEELCKKEENSKYEFPEMINEFKSIPQTNLRYDRVIVLVMESVNYQEFMKSAGENSDHFYTLNQRNIINYSRYYGSNLDSYTGLMVMLNGVMIPYQAYVSLDKYEFLNQRPNLVGFFRKKGYVTYFLTSYGTQQKRFIPDAQEWNEIRCLDTFPESYTCMTSIKIERACEDFALWSDLSDALKKNPKIFLFQEMVYGHNREWPAKKGMGIVDYYNRYFNALISMLEKENMLEKTLIVITSDHGPRQNQTNAENYHIPLLFWSKNNQQKTEGAFLSNIDFKDILLHRSGDIPAPAERQKLFTIGNSGNLHYGVIHSNGKYSFIYERLRKVNSNESEEGVRAFQHSFARYRNTFDKMNNTKAEP